MFTWLLSFTALSFTCIAQSIIQWNLVTITNSIINEHLVITNIILGQSGHFSTQINPVIMNKNCSSWAVRYNQVCLYFFVFVCSPKSQSIYLWQKNYRSVRMETPNLITSSFSLQYTNQEKLINNFFDRKKVFRKYTQK